jgi:hypothetical protein
LRLPFGMGQSPTEVSEGKPNDWRFSSPRRRPGKREAIASILGALVILIALLIESRIVASHHGDVLVPSPSHPDELWFRFDVALSQMLVGYVLIFELALVVSWGSRMTLTIVISSLAFAAASTTVFYGTHADRCVEAWGLLAGDRMGISQVVLGAATSVVAGGLVGRSGKRYRGIAGCALAISATLSILLFLQASCNNTFDPADRMFFSVLLAVVLSPGALLIATMGFIVGRVRSRSERKG